MFAYLLGALLFVFAIVVFIFQNPSTVIVNYLGWTSPEISLALFALISACVGALLTFLLDSYRAFRTGRKIKEQIANDKKYKKKIKQLEDKITGLEAENDNKETIEKVMD